MNGNRKADDGRNDILQSIGTLAISVFFGAIAGVGLLLIYAIVVWQLQISLIGSFLSVATGAALILLGLYGIYRA
ncbi:hypothetical protein U3A55_01685 [Salarchaeum sp. III]|uniref:hypothetical protein n=1 Tax=Salarchaeum sp. III TaxID=3107927 RepID=UPI002ED94CB3